MNTKISTPANTVDPIERAAMREFNKILADLTKNLEPSAAASDEIRIQLAYLQQAADSVNDAFDSKNDEIDRLKAFMRNIGEQLISEDQDD